MQDTDETEDGTLEMDEAPEDVIHFCFLPSIELSGGKVFVLGKVFINLHFLESYVFRSQQNYL